MICEDIWYPEPGGRATSRSGAVDSVCCISASPYHRGKGDRREQMLATRADDCAAALAFCNQVGGQDELVFDGRSALFDAAGELVARASQFEEHLLVADVDIGLSARRRLREPLARRPSTPAEGAVTRIAVTPAERNGAVPADGRSVAASSATSPRCGPPCEPACATIVDKNRFPGVLVGLSGGSTPRSPPLPPRTPCRSGSRASRCRPPTPRRRASRARRSRAESLAVRLLELPIALVTAAFDEVLAEEFAGREPDITEENLQARARARS